MSAGGEQQSGAERAAAFLFSLDKDAAANVLKHLDESVIVEVVEAMAQLDPGSVDADAQRSLEKELIRSLRRPRRATIRSDAELRRLLEETLGRQQASQLFDKIHQRLVHERPFISIEKESPVHIAQALAEESDAVTALVLAHFDPSLSAEILGSFEPERTVRLVKRMATLIPPPFETLAGIAQELETRLKDIASRPSPADPAVRLRSIAEMLNFSQSEVEKSVLEGLDAEDSEMAGEIREFMFTWEDLAKVDKRSMQKILTSVDMRTLSIALKACSAPVETNIMQNLSSRVREMVVDERELAGAMPMKDVLAARAEVMKAVRGLMEAGEFQPARAGEDLVS